MPGEQDSIKDFLNGIGETKENPFKSADPFEIPLEEKEAGTEEEGEAGEEKPLPFHKDPKVQRYVEKEIKKALEKVTPDDSRISIREEDDQDDVTSVLERIIGNDTPEKQQAVKDFRKVLGNLEDKGAQKAIQKLEEQSRTQRAEEEKARTQLDDSFEEIEESFGVDLTSNAPQARKTRSEFIDYVRKIAPKDSDGEVIAFPDMPSAWEEFQERQKKTAPASRAKELAARGMTRSSEASSAPTQTGKSWKEVEKLFNRLSS